MVSSGDSPERLLIDTRRYLEQLREEGEGWVSFRPAPESRETPRRPDPPVQADGGLREQVRDCRACRLAQTRRNTVFGEGAMKRGVMLIGEGPGAREDATGRPFVGPAGMLLDKMLAAIGLGREDVFITNIVKCRPPGNRDPERDEVTACWKFLEAQIQLLRPRVIVALGAPASRTLLDTDLPIGKLRGRFHDCGGIPLLPTYHPAYLLRNPADKRKSWEDLQSLRNFLKQPGQAEG